MTMPLGLFQPIPTPLHRISPGLKLAGLFVIGIAITAWPGPWAALGTLAGAVVVLGIARLRLRSVLWQVRFVLIMAAGLVAYHAWATTWLRGAEIAGNLIALVLLATVFTATTRLDDLIDAVVRGATRLKKVPGLGRAINPGVIALTIALMLRSIPALTTVGAQVRDAARARGLERNPRALVVPIALRTVARAQATGEALHARGIVEHLA